jgi:hypothetical protein
MADDYSREIADLALRRAALSLGANKPAPDAAAKANRVARATGLPVATVDDNLDTLSRQVEVSRAQHIMRRNPELAAWVADTRNAAVGSDDIGGLAQNAKAWSRAREGSLTNAPKPEGTLWNSLKGIGTGFVETFARLPNDIQRVGADWLPSFDLAAPGTPRLKDAGQDNARRASLRSTARIDAATPDFKSKTARYLYGGVSSLAQTLPAVGVGVLTGGVGGLAAAGAQAALPAYSKYRDRGGTRGEALLGGALEGGIEVATEKLPMDFLVNRLGKLGAGKFIAGYLGRDMPGEMAASLAQNAIDTAIANPDKTWGEYLSEQPDALMQAAVSSLMSGAFFAGAGKVGRRFAQADARNAQAADDADTLTKAMDSAAASKTRARDPEAFQDFVNRFTEGSRVENVFVPAETVATYFQSQDIDYREDDFWRDYAGQIEEGLQTGGDIVLPTAAAAAHLSGTPVWDAIKNDARTSPGGPSLAEVESQRASYEETMEQLGSQMAEQMQAEQEADAPRMAIYNDIRDKLTNAGHTQEFAAINAELVAQRYATRAARQGQSLTGQETVNITVNAVLPENLAPIVAKDAGDVGIQSVINVMRRGLGVKSDRLKFGDSLVEWISKNGGIEDKGGDLTALGADAWHKGKPGKRKLIRPMESGQSSFIAGARDNANTPDELALRAQEAGYFPAGERPEIGQLFEAIESELRGEPVYAQYAGGLTDEDNTRAAAEELMQILEQRGLDPEKATDREIKETLQQYRQEQADAYRQDADFGRRMMAVVSDRFPGVKLDLGGNGGTITISRIEVPSSDRDSGVGSEIMKMLTDAADAAGVRLALTPSDTFGGSVGRLREFYKRFGFKENKGKNRSFTTRESMVRNPPGQSYDQTFGDGPRGQISFTQGRSIIDLFQERNTSTFAHEMGHQWLEELRQDAERDDATDQVRADWQTVQDWFASRGHPLVDGKIPVDAHELWARGIERYLMEGKAPSSTLRRVFDAFKSWLLHIYQVVDNLRSPITPEIREVMDRLLATDEEIADAREQQALGDLFNAAADAGMTEAEFAAYKALATDARDEAHSALLYRTMASIRAARTKEWKAEEARVRADVTERVDRRPEFRALHFLRTGKLREAPDLPANRLRIDKAWLVDRYGEGVLAQMPGGVPPLYVENGTHPDEIAEMVGFANGDEMVRTLITLQERKRELLGQDDKRSVRQALIDEETAQEMRDRHGDPLNDGSIEEEALAFVQNDTQGEKMAAELRVLARRSNRSPTPYSLAKDWARDKIASSTVQEATSGAAIQRYSRAAAKAGKAAEAAMVKRDTDEAFKQKQAQMLNNALVAEATRAREAVEKARNRLAGYARKRTIKSMDQDYLEQIHDLLEQVEFRPRTQASLDRQASFEEWAAAREAEGHDVVVPASFAKSLGTTHWSRLSVEKMLGLDDAVAQIAHLGRFKQELIDGAERRAFEEVVGEAVSGIGNLPPRAPVTFDPSWSDRMKSKVEAVDAALLKMETIVDWLDGGNSDGVFNRVVFRPIADAQAREQDMTRDYFARIKTLMEAVPNVARWADRVMVPELFDRETGAALSVTRQRLVAMALNMGNEGNIQRLTDGYGWNRDIVRDVLNRELTADDWRFVQGVWDTIETLWPEIAAMERRVNGVEPEKVEAVPIETSAGTLRGGYYPAIYDTSRDLQAERNAGKASDLLDAKYTRATTRASATKDRLEKVTRPILLEVGVINRHLGEVIHDITHREVIINAHKFLNDGRVQKAVNDTLGPEIRKQFQPWLKHVANQWAAERAGNEGLAGFMAKARANTTAVGMGFRLSTVITQVAGYANSQEVIGGKWLANAVAQSAANWAGTFRFVAERSGEIRNRMETMDRDIGQLVRSLDLNPLGKGLDATRNAMRFMYHGIGWADRIVVVPTWIAAYNKALAEGAEEQQAIYAADKAVRQSQGAGGAKDLSAVQQGQGRWGEALKLSTMFYSYFSALYQRLRTLGRDALESGGKPRDIPKLLARAWWLIIVPPLLSQIIAGKGPEEDEDWGLWSFKQMLFNMLAPIPFVRDLAQPAWDMAAGDRSFGYQLSPVQRAGETLVNVSGDAGRIVRGEETKRATRNALEATGYVTGLVPGQLATAAQFLVDVGYGDQDPETVGEWLRGLSKGKAKAEE